MIQNGEIKLADAKRVLRRYWWVLLTCGVATVAVALAVTFILPKRYTSTTLVLVEQPTVPSDYVRPVVSDDLNNRLASMKQQILSRSHLEPIIEKFGLYEEERKKLPMDDLIDKLRSAVDVALTDPIPGTQNHEPSGFRVSVTYKAPVMAQQICTEITSMFMEQNVLLREKQATQTTTFLSQQLDEAKQKLDAQDAELAQFKRQYFESLPDQEQRNLSLLTGMNSQLEANTAALSRAQQDKAFNESLLSSQQETNRKMSQTGQNPDTQQQQLALLEDQLAVLQSKYTGEHPDVIKLKTQIDELKRRIMEAPQPTPAMNAAIPEHDSPQVQQLRAKLRQDNLNIADLLKQQEKIQAQIRVLQAHVQSSPAVEEQYKKLTRNFQSALDFYNELLKKRDNSAMATDLEHQQQSETFKVLDLPSLPANPSFPKKGIFAGGGLVAGLTMGLGILYAIALTDKSLYTEHEVELLLKLPVLVAVPGLDGAKGLFRDAGRTDFARTGLAKSA
jgi:polysaccharide chain length determinant protein (PEP-CTERM system associated)